MEVSLNLPDDEESKDERKEDKYVEIPAAKTSSLATPTITTFNTIYEASKVALPYLLDPITGIDTFLPNISTMFGGRQFNPTTDIGSLAGKVILVTGGNTGIGKETILQLAKHDPSRIFLAARNEAKGRDAITSIKSQLPQDVNIEYLPLDLNSLKSVKSAADQFNSRSDRLDILILNAGIMAVPQGKTEDGFEIQLGTNHVGHFLLTKLLMPTLQKTAARPDSDVRIISLSSEAYNMGPNFDTIVSKEKLYQQSPWTRYGASKIANILFAAEMARKYPNMTSVSLHPGMVNTDLFNPYFNSDSILAKIGQKLSSFWLSDIPTGAKNSLWTAAGAQKSELTNGAYYTPLGNLRSSNKWANNAGAAKSLWDWTERELDQVGY